MPGTSATLPPALRHGAYSTATLLPGEDEVAFDRLHESLIAELGPQGALEEHIVANIARFVWRRDHLDVLRLAYIADAAITARYRKSVKLGDSQLEAAHEKAKAQTREQLGQFAGLTDVEISEQRLLSEIELRARLDEMVDKCLKRLLFLRGLKSVSRSASPRPEATQLTEVAPMEVPVSAEVDPAHSLA